MPTTRHATVTTPLEDQLYLRRMQGREELGQLFTYELELLSESFNIEAPALLGQHMTVHLETVGQRLRHFDGVVTQFAYVGSRGRYAEYRATLRPWLWLLTQSVGNAVFQELTIPDLVLQQLTQSGYAALGASQLSGHYDKRELVVQYRESLFQFVSRWLEHEGIFYTFSHEPGSHKLCLADDSTRGERVADYEELRYRAPTEAGRELEDHFEHWQEVASVIPEAYAVDSYNFKMPRVNLLKCEADPDAQQAYRVVSEAPATHTTPEGADRYAKLCAEAHMASQVVFEGTGNVRGLYPGALFKLTDHPRTSFNQEYCVISVEYAIESGDFESHAAGGRAAPQVSTRVRAIPAQVRFRTARRTPRPVAGTESAVVVGPKGSETSTDKYGRVRVQFHWDHEHQRDEQSSCLIRVAQPWAGSDYGFQFIPRVGHEVLVSFLNGNPDEPVIVGSVYNEDNQPPFKPGKHWTQSGLRTHSTKGGDKREYNELRFDDAKGREELHVRAQRDLSVQVNHDSSTHVAHDASCSVDNHLTVKVAEGDYDTFVSKGAMRAEVKDSLYGVKAKEVAISAEEAITLRVGDVSIRVDATSIALTVDKNAEIKLDFASLFILGTLVHINPPGMTPMGAAKLPELLSRMCEAPATDA